MTDLEVSVSAKLAVIWIFNTRVLLGTRPNLGFNMICFIFFNENFEHKESSFFTLHAFYIFLSKNKYINQSKAISLAFLVSKMA